MVRKILVGLSLMVIGGLISQVAVLLAQNMMTPPGKYISKAEVMKGVDAAVKTEGGQNFLIVPDLSVRRRLTGINDASIHSTATDGADVTEVMQVVDGSGTFMTGGNFVDTSDKPYKEKDRTKGIYGGVAHEVSAGDFVVIPPGTAHWFSKINDHVTLVETRFPGDVTKAKK